VSALSAPQADATELVAIGKICRRAGVALAGETRRDRAAFWIRASFGMELRFTRVGGADRIPEM